MKFQLDIACSQLNKNGEELCGDSIEIIRAADSSIIVLADGLGSGVKANILSRITAKTAATMLKMGGHIDDVIETMIETLPVCRLRNIAYSTFSILQIFDDGHAYLVEFDNPPAYWGYDESLLYLKRAERQVGDKVIKESHFEIGVGHWLVMMSDGILHAGLGGIWNLGWGEEHVGNYVRTLAGGGYTTNLWAEKITDTCNKFYCGKLGDDASVVVVKLRKLRKLTALIGPPRNPEDDVLAVNSLNSAEGVKVICGGTTSQLAGRILKREIQVNLDDMVSEVVPPTGQIVGIDLVTEGAITLYHTLQHLKEDPKKLENIKDGSGRLAKALLMADEIHFIVGLAINPVVHNPDFPVPFALKHQTVRDIADTLGRMGKKVTVEHY
ncbi:SpoIIE family protein phosphatase [Pelotomaculum propionicicum]|uniref:SpoIIE family protein phosphatase n=1 Tax=Pelotomaculum propionicicum TaxID=258475 RepID=UPI003B7B3C99